MNTIPTGFLFIFIKYANVKHFDLIKSQVYKLLQIALTKFTELLI